MVRKVGVNAHPPFITTAVRASDVIPQLRRGLSLNAEVALTAAIEACAAAPTRNDDGSAGSWPVSVTVAKGSRGRSTVFHKSTRIAAVSFIAGSALHQDDTSDMARPDAP